MAGLGNPGPRYERTRHNAGFMVIDELAARSRAAGRLLPDAWVAEASLGGAPALLVKPLSYMNLSGEPVERLLAEAGASAADLVVVVDDVALPLGRLRVRERGSDGGHNGLRSIAAALGSSDFARIRIGVGPDPGSDQANPAEPIAPQDSPEGDRVTSSTSKPVQDLSEFVLAEFLAGELPRLREVIGLAADAVACLAESGTAAAMNRFNGPRT